MNQKEGEREEKNFHRPIDDDYILLFQTA